MGLCLDIVSRFCSMKPPSSTASHSRGTALYAEETWRIATPATLGRLMRPTYRVFPNPCCRTRNVVRVLTTTRHKTSRADNTVQLGRDHPRWSLFPSVVN